MKYVNLPEQTLRTFTINIFEAIGVPEEDARQAADVLLKSDLRGIDSHGVARLSGYVRMWEKKRINTKPAVRVVHETASTATVDGDGGLGLVVAPKAMRIAIEKAEGCGTGWISVRNSNHFGIAGYHAMMALEKDMIGVAMTNASPLVAPPFSAERLLGTNPICYAFPAGRQAPVIVDMATAAAANGKLEIAQRSETSVPLGWIQNKHGQPSADPTELQKGGALLPLGSDREHGSHKGFCLSATVDILSSVLSGGNYGPWVPPFVAFLEPPSDPVGLGIGHFLGAMRVDGFRPAEEFKQHMDNWIERFKKARPATEGVPVIIPGEPEAAAEKERSENGIPVIRPVFEDLKHLSRKFNIELA